MSNTILVGKVLRSKGRLLALSANIRLGQEWFTMGNTLAYLMARLYGVKGYKVHI